jgi:hypothetical protein
MCDIAMAGGVTKGELNLRVFGMTLDMMNKLSKIGRLALSATLNGVRVDASNGLGGMTNVYQGTINEAWADFTGAPDCAFNVSAQSGWFQDIKPADPQSYQGASDVATVMADLASKMGFTFENNGVQAVLQNPYLSGTYYQQAQSVAQAADINMTIQNGVLAIWPRDGYRGDAVPLIAPETGLVGYPRFNATGITLVTLFNPAIVHGGRVQVKSQLTAACGIWLVNMMAHNLSSQMPNGPWFTTLECSSLDKLVLK